MSGDEGLPVDVLCARGDERRSVGDHPGAAEAYLAALRSDGSDAASRRGLAFCLARDPLACGPLVPDDVLGRLLNDPGIDPALVSRAVLLKATTEPDPLSHPLLPDLLGQTVVTLPSMERRLTAARRDLCLNESARPTAVSAALALQGRLNEFAWAVSDEERQRLLTAPEWVRAMYAEADAGVADHGEGEPADGTEAVRRQYEANPYPRWTRATRRPQLTLGRHLSRIAGSGWDPASVPECPDMLVAGCGTGRELVGAALSWTTGSITAFDLSSSSLAVAADQSRRHGVDVHLRQADLMQFDTGRFDVIVCTGVLHHLADPMAGWRRLRELLRPGGVMWIGLYSQSARRGIEAAQREVRERFDVTLEGIRAARQHILGLRRGHPARDCLLLEDFYYLSGCRDLLFHSREQCFTIPRLEGALAELDLRFLGFEADSAALHLHRDLLGPAPTLSHWGAVEDAFPGTFLGMYQFWCQAPE